MAHGGRVVAQMLEAQGVRRIFSVPGESFLAVLDGLVDTNIQNIVCRHEGGAAMMAEAHGKMTGRPGVAFVTRGPGATNASCGVHIARQDSTPMILFVGQIAREHRDREAFQEVDYRAMFGGLAKWVAEVDDPARLPEYVARAFRVAMAGRPGPVVLALPEDVLSAPCVAPLIDTACETPKPDLSAAASEIARHLDAAERPLVIVGGPHWSAEAARDLARFSEAQKLPVALSFRRQDYLDNRAPYYAGDLNVGLNPRLGKRVRDADLLLILGSRFGDIASQGYTLVDPAAPGKKILHVHADANELGRVWPPALAVTATAPEMVSALAALPSSGRDDGWARAARLDYDAWRTPAETPGALKLEQVMTWLSDNLPEDAILTNGAGNYAAFLHRYFVYKCLGTQLAPTSGSMGYGFPAAISASLEHSDRTVVCLAGDGCFQMTLNEMSTAVQHGARVIVIVVNNGRYGTIRMHQEKTYPARVSGTELANPDFAALAAAYGAFGTRVELTEDFPAAFEAARASGGLAVVEVVTDPEVLSTGQSLSAARAQGQAGQG